MLTLILPISIVFWNTDKIRLNSITSSACSFNEFVSWVELLAFYVPKVPQMGHKMEHKFGVLIKYWKSQYNSIIGFFVEL